MKKYFIVIILLCVAIFSFSCGNSYKTSTPSDGLLTNELTTKEKQSDLKNLYKVIKKYHADYTHKISKEDFEKAYDTLYENCGELSSDKFCFEIMKLLSLIGDNATKATLDSNRYANRYYLPFEVDKFEEGYIIYEASKDYKKYIGYQVLKIENTEINEVVNILKDYYSADTVERQKYLCTQDIVFWDLLNAAGIVNSKTVNVTLGINGDSEVVAFEAYKNSSYKDLEFDDNAPDLISKYNDEYYSFKQVENSIYIQFNVCNEDPNKSVETFVNELSPICNPDVFHSIILDLRNNPGGIQNTIYPLISLLQTYKLKNEKAQIFVLTGSGTMGVSVVNLFEKIGKIATVIGTETGGLNNFYGDKVYYTLHNSLMRISIPEENFDFYHGDEISVYKPDIEVIQKYSDYKNGVDTLISVCQKITDTEYSK